MKRVWICWMILALLAACSNNTTSTDPNNKPAAKTDATLVKGSLVKAVYEGELATVKRLVAAGADVNENIGTEVDEITPLLTAVAYGREDIALYLLDNKAVLHSAFKGYRSKEYATQVFPDGSKVPLLLRLKERGALKSAPQGGR